jgi:hypothetical protein
LASISRDSIRALIPLAAEIEMASIFGWEECSRRAEAKKIDKVLKISREWPIRPISLKWVRAKILAFEVQSAGICQEISL